jgi:hypothetical protein
MVKEEFGSALSRYGAHSWDKMPALRQAINHYEDRIILRTGAGKSHDKVHGDAFPAAIWNWQRVEQTRRQLVAWLVALTCVALLDESFHVVQQPRPVV